MGDRFLNKPDKPLILAVGVMGLALLAYLPTLAPTITWRHGGADSGELAAAVATLGIPHPPGYPAYVLVGRAWTFLPLGEELAYRLNSFSAVGAALAAALTTLTIWQLGRSLSGWPLWIGAMFGGLSLALAPLTWSQAIITEVYAPGLACFSLLTLGMARWHLRPHSKLLAAMGLLLGLGLGLLPQLILILPGIIGLLYIKTEKDYTIKNRAALFLGAMGLGLAIFLYLPVRALAWPFINWGNPSSPGRLWAMVSAAQYHQYFGLIGPGAWPERLIAGLVQLGQQVSWSGAALAGLGGYSLARQNRAILGYLLSVIGLTVLFRAVYPVAGNIAYLLPALAGLALLSGLGAAHLLHYSRPHIGQLGMGLLGLGLLLALGVRAYIIAPQLDLSQERSAELFGQETLAQLPPEAVLLSHRDETTFALWYQQAVGRRPDVAVVDIRLLPYAWYWDHLAHHYPDIDPSHIETAALERPVYELVGPPGRETVALIEIDNLQPD